MDDADVSVTFTSEAARIDLNFAPKELLAALFADLGASEAPQRKMRTGSSAGGPSDAE